MPQGISEPFFLTCLQNYGYGCAESGYITPDNEGVIKAFKAHFSRNQHPGNYDPKINEMDMLWAWGLNEKYKQE